MIDIVRYDKSREAEWDAFVKQSKNATFLHYRGYMDYHSQRFEDFSLMFYNKGHLMALLPANKEGYTLYSHGGLTFGGLLLDHQATVAATCVLVSQMNHFLSSCGFRTVIYKTIPHIYHTLPSEEDLYPLFSICKARLTRRDISSTISTSHALTWRKLRTRCAKKAEQHGVQACFSMEHLSDFWQVLDNNLTDKYHVHPVHSLEEIKLLTQRFPDNIKLAIASHEGNIVGGTLLYMMPHIVHTQYISATPEGKRLGAIDAIMHFLLHDWLPQQNDCKYFDFGKSTEQGGLILNENLISQKEGFGARGICYDTYEYTLS